VVSALVEKFGFEALRYALEAAPATSRRTASLLGKYRKKVGWADFKNLDDIVDPGFLIARLRNNRIAVSMICWRSPRLSYVREAPGISWKSAV